MSNNRRIYTPYSWTRAARRMSANSFHDGGRNSRNCCMTVHTGSLNQLALIKKFADATNKKAGEFYTPRSVVRLMVNILDPREGESIYGPACGTGGMLLEAVHHVKANHGDDRTLWGKLFGQEKNLTTSAIARMNLFLHGASDFQVIRGDTLRSPAFFSGDT